MDLTDFVTKNPLFTMLVISVPVLFLVGIALSSTAEICESVYVNGTKCDSEQKKQLALSSNVFFLVAALTAVISMLPMLSKGMGYVPIVGSFVKGGKRRFGEW